VSWYQHEAFRQIVTKWWINKILFLEEFSKVFRWVFNFHHEIFEKQELVVFFILEKTPPISKKKDY